MQILYPILLFIMIPLIIIAIPAVIIFYFYRLLRKKGYKKMALLMIVGVISSILYIGYSALYPGNKFYRGEFKKSARFDLPSDASFVNKDASYPDIHGDYCSAASVKLTEESYTQLLKNISSNNEFIHLTDSNRHDPKYYTMGNSALTKAEPKSILYTNEFVGSILDPHLYLPDSFYFYIGFSSDNKTIVFNRCDL